MIEVSFGGDWGAAAVTADPETGRIAVIDSGRAFTVHAEMGGPPASAVRLAAGDELPGATFVTDGLGRAPLAVATFDTLDTAPADLWFHPVDAAAGMEWYRYRVLAAAAGDTGGGHGPVLDTIPAGPVLHSIRWGWTGSDMASGITSQPARLREDCTVTALAGALVGDVGSTESEVEWVYSPDDGSDVPLGSVVVPAGQSWAENPISPTRLAAPGFLTPTLRKAPPSGTGGATAVSRVAVTATSTATGTAGPSTPFSASLPAGGAAGDMVVVAVTCQAPEPGMGSAWTKIAGSSSTGATPQSRTHVFWAPWSAALDMAVSLTAYVSGSTTIASTPIRATAVLLRSAAGTGPVVVSSAQSVANNSGGTVKTPAATAAKDIDLALVFAGWRTNSGVSGQTAAGPGTEIADATTSRDPAGNTNVGQAAYQIAGVAAGASVPEQTVTVSGGTGDVATLSTSAVMVAVRREPSVSAPTRIEGELVYQSLTAADAAAKAVA